MDTQQVDRTRPWLAVGQEVIELLGRVDLGAYNAFAQFCDDEANRWFFSGQGRSGLSARMAAMRDLARAMRSGSTRTIGFLVADIANSFFNGVARVLVDRAAEDGYRTFVVNTEDDLDLEVAAVRALAEKRVDGIVVVPSMPDGGDHLKEAGIPVVVLDRHIPNSGLSQIWTDDQAAAQEAVAHFVVNGHERIGLLVATTAVDDHDVRCARPQVSTVAQRTDGALAALSNAGLPLIPGMLRFSRIDAAVARDAAEHLLDKGPTAVFATNEDMVLGLLAACRNRQLRIAEDLSIVGFDDTPWAAVMDPPVTVLARPLAALAEHAFELLAEQMAGYPGRTIVLNNNFVIRSSVHARRRSA